MRFADLSRQDALAAATLLAGAGGYAASDLVHAMNQPQGVTYIDYDSPAHGGRLAPESRAVYKEVHQGLMNGTVSAEELRAAVSAGTYDYDPLLKAHFKDVMG